MKYLFIGAAAFMMFAPSLAQAVEMTDARYISASRCVAYAQLPQLANDAVDVSTLSAEVDSYRAQFAVRDRARNAARDARFAGMRAGDNPSSVASLRIRRDEACARFAPLGVLQAGATTPAS